MRRNNPAPIEEEHVRREEQQACFPGVILMVVPRYPPLPCGGAERQAAGLAAHLKQAGFDVRVITWDAGRHKLPRRETINGVPISRCREVGICWKGKRRFAGMSMPWQLLFHLVRHRRNARLVHVHAFNELAVWTKLICGVLRLPCVAKITGVRTALENGLRSKGPLRRLLWRALVETGYVQAMSPFVETAAKSAGVSSHRIVRLPNAVDQPAQFGPRASAAGGGLTVLATSALIPVKRLDLLVRAAAICHHRRPGIAWVVAGSGSEEQKLKSLAVDQGVAENIQWLGPRDDIADLLNKADVFAHPSEGEGLSNSILEAMAFALPVVARRAPFNECVIEDGINGLLFDGTPEDLADKVNRLAGDGAMRASLGASARECVARRYSWEGVLNGYKSMLRRIENT